MDKQSTFSVQMATDWLIELFQSKDEQQMPERGKNNNENHECINFKEVKYPVELTIFLYYAITK